MSSPVNELPRGWTKTLGPVVWNNNQIAIPSLQSKVSHVLDSFRFKAVSVDLVAAQTVIVSITTSPSGNMVNLAIGEAVLPAAASATAPTVDGDGDVDLGLASNPGDVMNINVFGADPNVTVFLVVHGYDF